MAKERPERVRLQRLQSLEDAISFRMARVATPCPDCSPSGRCDDHSVDLELIAGYKKLMQQAS